VTEKQRNYFAALFLTVLVGGFAVFVSASFLARDISNRCLRMTPPEGTQQSQAEVTASPDYLRGRLTCQWSDLSRTRVTSESYPLYRLP
jgi:hypothetical protein